MNESPVFHVLERTECETLLASQHVGRLAYSFRDRVDIEPVHYVFYGGHIYGRTQYGAKVDVLAHHPWVAFEVDRVESMFRWRSVVVHGRLEFPDPLGSVSERERYEEGVAAFRTLLPTAFTEDDPTPARELIFILPVSECTGRASTPPERS
jgi:hypothetical protein